MKANGPLHSRESYVPGFYGKDTTILLFDMDGTLSETLRNTGFDGMVSVTREILYDYRNLPHLFEMDQIEREETINAAIKYALAESAGTTDMNYLVHLLSKLGIQETSQQMEYLSNLFAMLRRINAVDHNIGLPFEEYTMAGKPYGDIIPFLQELLDLKSKGARVYAGVCTGNASFSDTLFAEEKLPRQILSFLNDLSPLLGKRTLLFTGNEIGFPGNSLLLTKADIIRAWIKVLVDVNLQIIFIDDNPHAFRGFEDGVGMNSVGLWLNRGGMENPGLPNNVTEISSLSMGLIRPFLERNGTVEPYES